MIEAGVSVVCISRYHLALVITHSSSVVSLSRSIGARSIPNPAAQVPIISYAVADPYKRDSSTTTPPPSDLTNKAEGDDQIALLHSICPFKPSNVNLFASFSVTSTSTLSAYASPIFRPMIRSISAPNSLVGALSKGSRYQDYSAVNLICQHSGIFLTSWDEQDLGAHLA